MWIILVYFWLLLMELILRVCFKNQKRAEFLGDLIGLADKKAHEHELSY